MFKFKIGEVVLYQNGEIFELGIVKECLVNHEMNCYRVWYHTGDTTALTCESSLYKINNAYAFTILRKQVDLNIKAPLTCRAIATEILSQFKLYGDMYKQLEDWLTFKLEGRNPKMPLGINGEYLRCALRIEVEDLFNLFGLCGNYSLDIENCVDEIMNHSSVNVLDCDFIEDICRNYCVKHGYKEY